MRSPVVPYPHQHLILSVFNFSHSVAMKWTKLMVILNCISLITKNAEYLFMSILAICVYVCIYIYFFLLMF